MNKFLTYLYMENKIREIYNQGFFSFQKLYHKLKESGYNITQKQVKDFLSKQETYQIHKQQKLPKSFFPITSHYQNQVVQIDLADMQELATKNKNFKYFLCVIDVFTRFAWVIPLKNKFSSTITDAMSELLKDIKTKPEIINCDNGSEFISASFKSLCDKYKIKINYAQKGDHYKLGIIDRFIRTLRGLIEKQMTMNKTNNYINHLKDLVHNYNHSYHSSIKSTPVNADPIQIKADLAVRQMDALMQETTFQVGQKVRSVINKTMFEKGATPKWSKIIHTIKSSLSHSYILDNDKEYKYYELQPVEEVETTKKTNIPIARQIIRKENKRKRILSREGIQMQNIISYPRISTRSTKLQTNVLLTIGKRKN